MPAPLPAVGAGRFASTGAKNGSLTYLQCRQKDAMAD